MEKRNHIIYYFLKERLLLNHVFSTFNVTFLLENALRRKRGGTFVVIWENEAETKMKLDIVERWK